MDVKGTITFQDVTTEFLLTDEGSYIQWGGTTEQLGQRTGLLEALGSAYLEWRQENLCSTCEERLLDDGEGYNGECGDCADRNPANREDGDLDDVVDDLIARGLLIEGGSDD